MEKWQEELKNSITSLNERGKETNVLLETIIKRHPMRIPKYYYDLIDQSDPDDPIKKLCYPNTFEADLMGEYDTSGEAHNTKLPGLQHKYKQTALVLTTSACFMYCRHCFRKRMVGYNNDEISNRIDETIKYLKEHDEINNVLLSGGDAFCLSNNQIKKYLEALTKIEHLNFIRFGTRSPVVFPSRINEDPELIGILEKYNKIKRIVIVTQFNHPRELTEAAKTSVLLLKKAGVSVNNQTVILKGVNDDPQTMANLLNGLNRVGINPYYVFQCRPVKAVKKGFQMTLLESYQLIENTRLMLDGMSKRFRLIMSHPTGKIEIIGIYNKQMIFRYHQAKNHVDHDKIFMRDIDEDAQWLNADLQLIL